MSSKKGSTKSSTSTNGAKPVRGIWPKNGRFPHRPTFPLAKISDKFSWTKLTPIPSKTIPQAAYMDAGYHMLDAKPDTQAIGAEFYSKLEKGGFVLQDDMVNFVLHSGRYNGKDRGLMFPADFNAKGEIAVTRKSRGRASKELKEDVSSPGKAIGVYYTSITKSSGVIVPLWGDEGELHFGDLSTKDIKAQLLRPALATLSPTRWQLEATTRPTNKPKANAKAKASKDDEPDEEHESEGNDEEPGEGPSNDHGEPDEEHESEGNDEQPGEGPSNDQPNDEETDTAGVTGITANLANDEETNTAGVTGITAKLNTAGVTGITANPANDEETDTAGVTGITANPANDEETDTAGVTGIATNPADVTGATVNLAFEIQGENITETEPDFTGMIDFEDDMVAEADFEDFDNMEIDSKNQQRSMRLGGLVKGWKTGSIVFPMNRVRKAPSTARPSLSPMRKAPSTARPSLSPIPLRGSTLGAGKSKGKATIQPLPSSTSLLAKLEPVPPSSVHKKTRTLMWRASELISFLSPRIRSTQGIDHLQSFLEAYDDLAEELNNDNEDNL